MADLSLDILVIPTYNTLTVGVADNSIYPDPNDTTSPSIEICVPGFDGVDIVFTQNSFNVFNSYILGLTGVDDDLLPLPDGVYTLTYSVTPPLENFVTKTIIRVEQLQQKFDEAFMKLDMMQCDQAIKTQSKVDLNSIYFLIQGAIAAANNCAVETAQKLYNQASKQLGYFILNNCGCSGTNYITNFQ